MEKIKLWLLGAKRVSLDVVLLVVIGMAFFDGLYGNLSNPVQLLMLKVILVSGGLLHAHWMGKLVLPKVDWNLPLSSQKGAYYARVSLYIILPICYSLGG